jgi:hypothetical protein
MNTIKKIDDNYILHRNNKPLACAIIAPIPVPGRIAGTVSMEQRPCGDTCPLFDITEGRDINGIIILNLCHNRTLKVKKSDEIPTIKAPILFPGTKY